MGRLHNSTVAWMVMLLLAATAPVPARAESEEDMAVLRNTVINILEALTSKGLISKEAADKLVRDAQAKAAAEVTARKAEDAPKPGDVRVTYVPEAVREQIRNEVKADLESQVTANVVSTAKEQGWGVPAALPEWVRNARWSGDVRLRESIAFFDSQNIPNSYLDYQATNQTGTQTFLNTNVGDQRFSGRLRFGGDFTFSPYATAGFRLSTGTTGNPVSLDQNLADYGRSASILLYEAWVGYNRPLSDDSNYLGLTVGRMGNPFQSTELTWDQDLRFSGLALKYSQGTGKEGAARGAFASAGIFPLQSVDLSSRDKWVWGAQAGWEQGFGGGLKGSLAAAFYGFENVTGRLNDPSSRLLDYTAPPFLQKGNTLFNIRRDNPATYLYALAAEFKLLDAIGQLSYAVRPDFNLQLTAEYVKNIGFDRNAVAALGALVVTPGGTPADQIKAATTGYRVEFRAGSPDIRHLWDWRVFAGYERLERDAVIDAFTDSDFHRGGTDAKGYFIGGDLGLTEHTWLRFRYLSADSIDGPPLGIDVLQVDLNAGF